MRKIYIIIIGLFSLKRLYSIHQKISHKMIRLLIPLLFVFYPVTVHCEDFVAASDTWSPFFMVSDNQFSGIGFDILTEVARRTGDRITFRHLPNKRAMSMFDRKEIDMMVIDSPLWNNPEKAKNMIFSNELMSIQEHIYFLKEKYIEVVTPADLRGETVNILRGYYYPVFEDAFKKGIVIKYEINNESSLLATLIAKRCIAVFMDSVAFKYNISLLGYDKKMFKRGLQLSNTTLGVKIRREKAHILPRLNEAIASMKKDGTINRIIKKYTE